MSKKTSQITKSGAKMLDPDHVGSSIRYRATVYRGSSNRLCAEAQVMLTDCDRTIQWSGYGSDTLKLQARIDTAIEVLHEARNAIATVAKEYLKQSNKRRTKK